jgi:hypothetical protein
MSDLPKTPWPETYLGRLQAVTAELRGLGSPITVEAIAVRFSGATTVEVESTLAALVLFGRVRKVGVGYLAAEEG